MQVVPLFRFGVGASSQVLCVLRVQAEVCACVCFLCVCWGWGGTPECHLFSVMWPSTDTVNHWTGGTWGTHTHTHRWPHPWSRPCCAFWLTQAWFHKPRRVTYRQHHDHRTVSGRHACMMKQGNGRKCALVLSRRQNEVLISTRVLMNCWPLLQLTQECHRHFWPSFDRRWQ